MPAHHLPNCDGLPKTVVLTDVDYLGPDGWQLPMLFGSQNQHLAVHRRLAHLSAQRLFFERCPFAFHKPFGYG